MQENATKEVEVRPDEPPVAEGVIQELLFSGNEQVLRGSDHGTLVAFASIAFQGLRGGGDFSHHVGCGFLLVSVIFCALVHFAMGNAYIFRARTMTRRDATKARRRAVVYTVNLGIVWAAVLLQFASITLGLFLILPARPPELLSRYLLPLFGSIIG